jgi:hypothetical protein
MTCPTCGRKSKRSTEANARYWALLHAISSGIKTADGYFNSEVWHKYFKAKYLGCTDIMLPNRKIISEPNSTSELDMSEFNDYMTKVEVFANDHGAYLEE